MYDQGPASRRTRLRLKIAAIAVSIVMVSGGLAYALSTTPVVALLVSSNKDLSAPKRLAHTVLSSTAYFFLGGDVSAKVASVTYYLDDALGTTPPVATLSTAPFVLTEDNVAELGAGWHSILAAITTPGGREIDLFARFQVVVLQVDPPTTSAPATTEAPTPTTAAPTPATTAPTTALTTTPPASATGAKPGADNTGVPAGTQLKLVDGDQTYSMDGQVIEGLDVNGKVTIKGNNITLRKSTVRGPAGGGCVNGAAIEIQGTGVVVEDTEVMMATPTACLDGVWAANATLTRMNIHGGVDGVKAEDNTTIQDSYIHDLDAFASDPNQGGGATHNDAIQTFIGNMHIFIKHNNLVVTPDDNATLQVTQDGGGKVADLWVQDNWLDGGGCTLNFSHKGGPTPMTDIHVLNNRFGHNSSFSCPILISTQTVLSENSGNVYDDTGAPIPEPQQHD